MSSIAGARRLEQLGLRLGRRRTRRRSRLSRSYSAIGSRAVVELVGVVEPVLVAGRLVAVALLVDPRPSAEPVNGPIDAPNRNVTETKPSLHGHSSWMSSPPVLTPPLIRCAAAPPSGTASDVALRRLQHRALRRHLDVLAAAARRPLGQRQQRPDGGVGSRRGGTPAAPPCARAARSSSPVIASWHAGGLDREVGGRPRRLRAGRRRTRVIDTVTSAGSAARSAARSTGTAPHSITTSAPAHSRAERGLPGVRCRGRARRCACRGSSPRTSASARGPRPSPANGPRRRPPEPSGGSTSMTSAPSPASMNAARLPRSSVRSTTRYLSSIPQPYRSHRTARS